MAPSNLDHVSYKDLPGSYGQHLLKTRNSFRPALCMVALGRHLACCKAEQEAHQVSKAADAYCIGDTRLHCRRQAWEEIEQAGRSRYQKHSGSIGV